MLLQNSKNGQKQNERKNLGNFGFLYLDLCAKKEDTYTRIQTQKNPPKSLRGSTSRKSPEIKVLVRKLATFFCALDTTGNGFLISLDLDDRTRFLGAMAL